MLCTHIIMASVLFRRIFKIGNVRSFSTSMTFSSPTEGRVFTTKDGGIRTIILNSPLKLNAISNQMYADLAKSLHDANTDNATKVVAITGHGNFFTSGNEFANFHSSTADVHSLDKNELTKKVTFMIDLVKDFVGELIELKKPLIALVNGPCIGIGVTMLGHCDAVYCTESVIQNICFAYFTTPFTTLGICPEACSSYLFPRLMGHSRASNLLMFNARLRASEAYCAGLVTQVFTEFEFKEASRKVLEEMVSLPSESLLASKELLRGPDRKKLHAVNRAELHRIALLLLTDECHEACECILHHHEKPRK